LIKKLLLASALALASFPGIAHADSCADYNACFLEEGNKLDENGAPQCGNKPPKCEIDLALTRDCIKQSGSGDGTLHEPEEAAAFDRCMKESKPQASATVTPPFQGPPPFKPWQQVWQCNDIRIVEFSNRQGLIEYDLGGTIWGGARFARDLSNRDMLFFNGRPCLKVAR
jgi:hypothetical protein